MTSDEHDRVSLLLPWYVNDTLASDERAEVAAHLQNCHVCRDNLVDVQRLQEAVRSESPTPLVPKADVHALMRSLDGSEVAGAHRRSRYVAAAASIALLAIVGWILLAGPPSTEPAEYQTVTDPSGSLSGVGYVFELQFHGATTDSRRSEILKQLGAERIQRLDASSLYRVTVQRRPSSLAELQAVADELAERPEIDLANVVAVELPLE